MTGIVGEKRFAGRQKRLARFHNVRELQDELREHLTTLLLRGNALLGQYERQRDSQWAAPVLSSGRWGSWKDEHEPDTRALLSSSPADRSALRQRRHQGSHQVHDTRRHLQDDFGLQVDAAQGHRVSKVCYVDAVVEREAFPGELFFKFSNLYSLGAAQSRSLKNSTKASLISPS